MGEHIETEIILGMSWTNERKGYYILPSLIGQAHAQNDPWLMDFVDKISRLIDWNKVYIISIKMFASGGSIEIRLALT